MAKKKAKTQKADSTVYVIAGKDTSLVNYHCRELLDELIDHDQRTTGLFDVDPDRVTIAEVLDELRTMPFLTDRRVVLIRNADDFVSTYREQLETYFDNPCNTAALVLTVTSWNSRTRLAKKLPQIGTLISIAELKRWEIPVKLIEYASQAHSKRLAQDTANLLVDLAGEGLARLYGEIDKLAIYARDDNSIKTAHVQDLIGHNRMFNAFAVIDAVTAGDPARAVARLRKMFAEDKSTEYTVVGAFAYHFRRQFQAKVLLQKGGRPDEVSRRLGIWHSKDAFFAQLKRLPLERIGGCLSRLAEIDFQIKTGQTRPQVAIERLVLSLAS